MNYKWIEVTRELLDQIEEVEIRLSDTTNPEEQKALLHKWKRSAEKATAVLLNIGANALFEDSADVNI